MRAMVGSQVSTIFNAVNEYRYDHVCIVVLGPIDEVMHHMGECMGVPASYTVGKYM